MSDFWNDIAINAIQEWANRLLLEDSVPTPADGVVPEWLANQLTGPPPEPAELTFLPSDAIH